MLHGSFSKLAGAWKGAKELGVSGYPKFLHKRAKGATPQVSKHINNVFHSLFFSLSQIC